MILKQWYLPILTVLMLVSCTPQQASNSDRQTTRYFEETGYTVQGEFLHFFEMFGGVDNLGYPLTEEIVIDGWAVQYFTKGRLEHHPENEAAYRVTVGWLGDLLHRRRPPIPPVNIPPASDPNRRYFPETGHTASGDFLRHFNAYGGKVRFGWPISEPFLLEGRLTQDFQSARFFWTPGLEPPVTLEEIGRIHFEESGVKNE
jgi:hypothetical protein